MERKAAKAWQEDKKIRFEVEDGVAQSQTVELPMC